MSQNPVPSPLQPWRFVGRARELDAIRSALASNAETTRVFYFVAQAGIGKTRLLKEAERIVKEDLSTSCRLGGFFDFYNTELHSNSRLERYFLDNLDPTRTKFTGYRRKREEYEELRRRAPSPARLDEIRRELGKLLIQGLNQIAAEENIKWLFCFDTLEALQFESGIVEEIIGPFIQQEVIETRDWLATFLPALKNAVILFAGRPKPVLENCLQTAFANQSFEKPPLGNFAPPEVKEYLTVMAETCERNEQADVARTVRAMTTDTYIDRVHYLTGGRPLLLSFAIDLLRFDVPLPEEFKPETPLPHDAESVQNKLAELVMNKLGSEDVATTLLFIGLARKGIDAELLEEMMKDDWSDWNRARCEKVLTDICALSYAKPRTDEQGKLVKLFLHDEMYDLIDQKVIRSQNIGDYTSKCEPLINCYDGKIQYAKQTGNRAEEYRLRAEQLWYRLMRDPSTGYHHYSAIFDRAIIDRQIGLDMQVRDEMLRFFQPDTPQNYNLERAYGKDASLTAARINRGAGIRWVHRLIATGQYEKAIQASQKLKASSLVDPKTDPLFVPILDTWEGEAKAYLGTDLADRLATFDRALKGLDDAKDKLDTEYLRKLWARNKGRAFSSRGYALARANQDALAVEEYRKALPLLRETGLPHQTADTTKNLAFANMHLGKILAATAEISESIRICQKHKLGYLLGLAQNTMALIEMSAEQPGHAAAWARQAIQTFESLKEGGEIRGIGLANLALGEANRRLAKLGIDTPDMIEKYLKESENALNTGLDIFKPDGKGSPERSRELEAHQELGCLYRQWARHLSEHMPSDTRTIAEKVSHAITHFDAARSLATDEIAGAKADILNDLADLYFNQDMDDVALAKLTESDAEIMRVDPNYALKNNQGEPSKPMANLYTILGKNYLLRGRIALKHQQYDQAAESYTFASACFDRIEGDVTVKQIAARRVYKIYSDLVSAGLMHKELELFNQQVERVEQDNLAHRPGFQLPTTLARNFGDVMGTVRPILERRSTMNG